MKLKVKLTTEEKKLLGRIFIRLTPLLKTSFSTKDSYIDLFEIVKVLPINFNLYEFEAKPDNINNIDVFFAAEKAGELNNISIQINLYNTKDAGDNFEIFLKQLLLNQKQLSFILMGIMRELLNILHKFFHPIIKNKHMSLIRAGVAGRNLDSNDIETIYNVSRYCYLHLNMYKAMSPNGIKKNIPVQEVLGDIFNDYLDLPNMNIEKVIQIVLDLQCSNTELWQRIHAISFSDGIDTIQYLGRFHNIGQPEDDESPDIQDGLVDAVNGIRSSLTNRLAGTGSARMMDLLDVPIEVEVDWLSQLKSLILEESNHYTSKMDISYRKIKNKYRHVANLPGVIHYDNRLKVICVVDQSGSVGDYELRKINFVMQKLSEKAKEFDLIIHDSQIVVHEKFRNRTLQNDVTDYIQKRQSYGGTCHTEVFNRIEEEYLNPDNAKNKFIVLTFSDMYSNIENLEQSGNYTWMERDSGVSKYWVTTDKEITSVDGIHIHVDKGVIA